MVFKPVPFEDWTAVATLLLWGGPPVWGKSSWGEPLGQPRLQ